MEQNKLLAARFAALKTRGAGNREKKEFEFTFGRPVEEKNHITGLSKDNKRILSEIHFALGLSAARDGKYDGEKDAQFLSSSGTFCQTILDRMKVVYKEAGEEFPFNENDLKRYKIKQ